MPEDRHFKFRAPAPSDTDMATVTRIRAALDNMILEKNGAPATWGWGPRLRLAFGHASPDDWYEALLTVTVNSDTRWLDVGCGRDLLPNNVATARRLSRQCRKLVGVDPDANIEENQFVHERFRGSLEAYVTDQKFDLITLRMVAEHVSRPDLMVAKLHGLLAPGGRVVIYTVNRRSPSAFVASITPLWLHHAVKRVLWRAEERDTFETCYLMNDRKTLRSLFDVVGMTEELFVKLDDCRTTTRFQALQRLELSLWRVLNGLNLSYPEACILAIYRNVP